MFAFAVPTYSASFAAIRGRHVVEVTRLLVFIVTEMVSFEIIVVSNTKRLLSQLRVH